jgi:hypothetical protein
MVGNRRSGDQRPAPCPSPESHGELLPVRSADHNLRRFYYCPPEVLLAVLPQIAMTLTAVASSATACK